MKAAQEKIDRLLEVLVNRAEAAIGTLGTNHWSTPDEVREELEWLVKMSNLNNARLAKAGKEPGPQAKEVPEMSDVDLVAQLKAGRDPDQFPRRGPRKGKRENPGFPLPRPIETCAMHDGVILVAFGPGEVPRCPDCAKQVNPPDPTEGIYSLKALK